MPAADRPRGVGRAVLLHATGRAPSSRDCRNKRSRGGTAGCSRHGPGSLHIHAGRTARSGAVSTLVGLCARAEVCPCEQERDKPRAGMQLAGVGICGRVIAVGVD